MDLLPVYLNIKGEKCLLVGGSDIAVRNASILLEAGAKVGIVAQQRNESFDLLSGWKYVAERFEPEQLDGVMLVVAAADDLSVNKQIAREAKQRHIPVYVVDMPDLSTFTIPTTLDRAFQHPPLNTAGTSPEINDAIANKTRNPSEPSAKARLFEMLEHPQEKTSGEVYLVGAGPGDPDLLTFRALRLMQKADVVVYDNLVAKPILEMTRRDAKRIFVGKSRGDHTMAQKSINDLLVRLAQEGHHVLRLKGGDPFIFGRGGEEIEQLSEHKIPFQVVPGITAASGVSAYAGIPLTHRDHAQSCVFVTGHLKDGSMDLEWDSLANPKQTIVVYMGLHGLETLCSRLMEHGLPGSTPAAIVQQGTTQNQRVMCGTLATLPAIAEIKKFKAPTLIIVGGVVSLREKLAWFEPVSPDMAVSLEEPDRSSEKVMAFNQT